MKFSDYIKENNCRTESIDNTKNTIHENDQKYNDFKKHLDEYSKYSSNELMNEFIKLTMAKKQNGELDHSELEKIRTTILPYLNEKQIAELDLLFQMIENV